MRCGNVIISFVEIIIWYFFLLIEGFSFFYWISIFKRLILDLSKKSLRALSCELRKKNHKFHHL